MRNEEVCMKKALVLAGGIPQIKLIKELKHRGYYVILADYTKKPVAEEYADKFYCKSTLDVEAMRNIAQTEKVDLIITCCTDQALATVSLLSEELGLPCYVDANIGMTVTNKQYMKKRFQEYQIPTADFCVIHSGEEEIDLNYPLVVKPVDCNSSKGVAKVYSDETLRKTLESALQLSRSHSAIVETYIEGQEVSVDVFVKNGRVQILCQSFTEKIKSDEIFVINRGIYPAILSGEVEKQIQSVAQMIADAFGIVQGPMLIQLLVKDDKIYVIEFSARTGGCIKYNMIELASGVDVIKLMVDATEGKQTEVTIQKSDKLVINEFVYASNGVFSHMVGVDECKRNGWIRDAFVLKTKGTVLGDVKSSGDRIAALTYIADNVEDYRNKHNRVCEHIKIIDCEGNNITRYDLLEIGDKTCVE